MHSALFQGDGLLGDEPERDIDGSHQDGHNLNNIFGRLEIGETENPSQGGQAKQQIEPKDL